MGKDTLDSASVVSSTTARLASTLAMAGDVMSILQEIKFSLTAELIANWVWYLEVVAEVSVVAKFKMCKVRNDTIYLIGTSASCTRANNGTIAHQKKLQARERVLLLGFRRWAVLLSQYGTLHT